MKEKERDKDKEINKIIKVPYPYGKITLKHIKYKNAVNNLENLNKEFRNFIGNYKVFKKAKIRVPNINTQMTRILRKLATSNIKNNNNSNLIKSLNNRFSGKNKRFMSAKEIEKFREKKNFY